jgi:hypothetical protein
MVAVPLTTSQRPVPEVAKFPASVKLLLLHCDWSLPAAETVTGASLVSDTISVVLHTPFWMVHLRTAVLLAGTPVTPDVAECKEEMAAVPLSTVQVPIPAAAVFPARVKLPLLHWLWLNPASAGAGATLFVRITSSKVLHE